MILEKDITIQKTTLKNKQPNMQTIKLIPRFFTKTKANEMAAYQKKLAKQQGRSILKVEVVNAYHLFKTNGWFKSSLYKQLGLPTPQQCIVIVHYKNDYPTHVNEQKVKILKPKNNITITSLQGNKIIPCKVVRLTATASSRKFHFRCTHTINAAIPINDRSLIYQYNYRVAS